MTAYSQINSGINGLDLVLDGGLRFPSEGSLFLVILGGPGTGKTNLALELTVRLLARSPDPGSMHLYYGRDQSPREIHNKLREDFAYYGIEGEWNRLTGAIKSNSYEAVVNSLRFLPNGRQERYFLVASLLGKDRDELITGNTSLFQRIDRDVEAFMHGSENLGVPVRPRLLTIDNISLTSFLDDGGARASLQAIRENLFKRHMHGIFVVETPVNGSDHSVFAAAEYSADVIIQLGYHAFGDQFKERSIEIAKARHQFYFRGTHHFSIVGLSGNTLRGGRGERTPGIHVYPSIPTLMSYLKYYTDKRGHAGGNVDLGTGDIKMKAASPNGLLAPRGFMNHAHRVALRFLLKDPGTGLLISFQKSGEEILETCLPWLADLGGKDIAQRLEVLSFEPEYISSGKFLKDVYDHLQSLEQEQRPVVRVALCGLGHLRWGFPLLHDAKMLIPWLSVFFRRQEITSLFVESSIESERDSEADAQSPLVDTVDNLLQLKDDGKGGVELRVVRNLSISTPDSASSRRLPNVPPRG